MCGIVGYYGPRNSKEILLNSLRRLEYRGYDSAGVALFLNGHVQIFRKQGKVSDLSHLLDGFSQESHLGIGHTRWATHGKPSERNAHPHRAGSIILVHNGIVENHGELREKIVSLGRPLSSDTDSELIAHLIAIEKEKGASSLLQAVRNALKEVEGTYALVVLDETDPNTMVGVRNRSPLILGLGDGEFFLASDIPAILPYTRNVIPLEDGDFVEIRKNQYTIFNGRGEKVNRKIEHILWDSLTAEKGGYPHFMLKEIHEQPRTVNDTLLGRIDAEKKTIRLEELGVSPRILSSIDRIVFVACGTSWHASLVGKYLSERFLRIPASAEIASEFRYRNPVLGRSTLVVLVSQSGETADTLGAVHLVREMGAPTIGICNVVGSTLSRICDEVIYTRAGPEISVASTKAFVAQITAIQLLLLAIDQIHSTLDPHTRNEWFDQLLSSPTAVETALKVEKEVEKIANKYVHYENMLYLGRGIAYPLAMEGALKLKEISYLHAEAYPAGEMKHGPIALIDHKTPVCFVAHYRDLKEKVVANMEEVKARDGKIVTILCGSSEEISRLSNDLITIPSFGEFADLLSLAVPLQLFAYYVAKRKGTDIDQPRNLAKSVTVE
jgi:glucosamine--fructose-6-phosphate aminotransferase (isomerizing)